VVGRRSVAGFQAHDALGARIDTSSPLCC
jgi:hypothetical protein